MGFVFVLSLGAVYAQQNQDQATQVLRQKIEELNSAGGTSTDSAMLDTQISQLQASGKLTAEAAAKLQKNLATAEDRSKSGKSADKEFAAIREAIRTASAPAVSMTAANSADIEKALAVLHQQTAIAPSPTGTISGAPRDRLKLHDAQNMGTPAPMLTAGDPYKDVHEKALDALHHQEAVSAGTSFGKERIEMHEAQARKIAGDSSSSPSNVNANDEVHRKALEALHNPPAVTANPTTRKRAVHNPMP